MKKKILYALGIIACVYSLVVAIIMLSYNATILQEIFVDDMPLYARQLVYVIINALSVVVLLCVIAFMTRALILECLPALRERIEAKKQQKLVKAEQDKAKRIERLEKELDKLKKDK